MTEPEVGRTERIIRTLVGATLLTSVLGPRGRRRLAGAGAASLGCSLGLVLSVIAVVLLGLTLLAVSIRLADRLLRASEHLNGDRSAVSFGD